jgi:hypothetical protein
MFYTENAPPPDTVSVATLKAPPPDIVPNDTDEAPPPPNNNKISSDGRDLLMILLQHLLIRYVSLVKSGLQLIDAYIGLLFIPIDPGYCVFRNEASARTRRLLV